MSESGNGKPVEILLVEDNPGDVRMTREVLQEITVPARLSVTKDGVDGIAFLRREGQYTNAPRPDIVLLDLNMPRKSGFEMLAEMKNQDGLKGIPVMILTSSEAEQDVDHSFGLDANCFLTKPIDANRLAMILRSVQV